MQRVFTFLMQVIVFALVAFAISAILIVMDGLTDGGNKADVGLVAGATNQGEVNAMLQRAVQLYNQGVFTSIIVSGTPNTYADPEKMAGYLRDQSVDPNAIFEDNGGNSAAHTIRDAVDIMKTHDFQSVMIITDYYHVTVVKLLLMHDGIKAMGKAHVGQLQKEDAIKIGREVVTAYIDIWQFYLEPAVDKIKKEAGIGIDKAEADAHKAKEAVDKKLDSMPK